MNKINKFCITSIKMQGFKRFKESYQMDLDRLTYISGGNGQGKSTIADAISYAFCGTPFWGEKSSERLLNSESSEMSVEVQLVEENGEVHTLSRRRSGNNTTIVFDTLSLRQTDIVNLFAEKDVFLSLINPIYFIEKIAEDGREFLQKLVPTIEQSEVMAQMGESIRALLEGESLLDPEFYVKKKREELKALEDSVTYLEGQKDLLKKQYDETGEKIDAIIQKGDVIVKRKNELEKKQYDGIDVEALKQKKEKLSETLSDDKRMRLIEKQAEAQNRQYVSKFTEQIAKVDAEIESLSVQCKRIVAQTRGIKIGDVCPTCHTTVTEANYQSIIAGMKAQYEEICAKGQSAVSARNELLALDKKSAEKFEEFKAAELQRIAADLAELGIGDAAELGVIDEKLKYGNLSPEEFAELEALTAQADAYLKEVEVLCESNDIPKKLEEIEKSLAENTAKKKDILDLIHAAGEYAAKRAELTLQSLKMNRASIKLFDVVKSTGEVKNVFRFTYDGKDYRWLSTSEKIKAGLEVSSLLERLTGLVYPKYIDNAECITTKFDPINGQVILAYARNTPLSAVYPLRTKAQVKEAA